MTGPRLQDVRVDDAGIHFRTTGEAVVDVCFDGRRIWSFWLERDSTEDGGSRLAAWPSQLTRFLQGSTRLTLIAHVSGDTLFDGEVRLGSGEGRIAVVNAQGKPLGLDKSNRLSQTFDTRSPEQVAPLLDAIDAVLDGLRQAGVDGFLAYGTLLGAVREGGLIGHDSDADLGYVSRHDHPADAIRESLQLQRRLVDLGFRIYRYSGLAFRVDVEEADGSRRGLDVFGGFIAPPVGEGRPMLYLMGEIGAPFERSWIEPLGTATLEGREFPVPAQPERLLEATYGAGWRVPDPAYHFETPRTTVRRLSGWFRGGRFNRQQWERRYSRFRSAPPPREPSDLARLVVEEEGVPAQVVDLGAGRGGDALWLARQGASVVALDYVPWFTEPARLAAVEEGLDLQVRLVNVLSLRTLLAEGSRLAHTPGPRTILCRHLVDATTALGRDGAWRLCDMALRDGGRLHLQFWSAPELPENAPGLERPVPADVVAAELADHGATIVRRTESPDPAGKDRVLVRMVAEWRR